MSDGGPSRPGDPVQDGPLVRRAVSRFMVSIVFTLLVLLVAAFLLGSRMARDQALREARARAISIAQTQVSPLLGADVRAHRAGAIDRLDQVMSDQVARGSVRHVKVWSVDGEVLWSDERALIGRRFPLPGEVRELGSGEAFAELSDLSKAENVAERQDGQLLEVYVDARGADGSPFVFEAYLSTDRLRAEQRAITTAIFGVATGVLVLFAGAVLPMGVSLARRVERGRQDRLRLTRQALYASDLERRLIAQELHDGVIQDLAGISYLLPNLQSRVERGRANATDAHTFTRIGELLARDVSALRSMLVQIYPPDLEVAGLRAAAETLAQSAAEAGISVDLAIPSDLRMPRETTRLAYGVLREGMRNCVKHSHAENVLALVEIDGDDVVVAVVDDGRGLSDAGDGPLGSREGHFGLRLLRDTIADVGGHLLLTDSEDGGARLEARFPAVSHA